VSKHDSQSGQKFGWKNIRQIVGLNPHEPFVGGVIFILILVVFALFALIFLQGQPELRDWVTLFILLLMLIGGALMFIWTIRRSEQRTQQELKLAEWYTQHERELEMQRLQEAAFQTYLDRMTTLLLDQGLRRSKPGNEVRDIARARTLTTLRGLDGPHKGILLRFLYEADLITGKGIVDLSGANLRGADLNKAILRGINLNGVDLSGADLSNADLSNSNLSNAGLIVANLHAANLRGANLAGASLTEAVGHGAYLDNASFIQADLHGANLECASLTGANLTGAKMNSAILMDADANGANLHQVDLTRANLNRTDLTGANLSWANLSWANLSWAKLNETDLSQSDLHGANLEGAEVVGSNLKEAKSLKGITMPDGAKHA
jgi:uncharacterized protein YjbI with pentapeptide repeats